MKQIPWRCHYCVERVTNWSLHLVRETAIRTCLASRSVWASWRRVITKKGQNRNAFLRLNFIPRLFEKKISKQLWRNFKIVLGQLQLRHPTRNIFVLGVVSLRSAMAQETKKKYIENVVQKTFHFPREFIRDALSTPPDRLTKLWLKMQCWFCWQFLVEIFDQRSSLSELIEIPPGAFPREKTQN